MLAGLGDMPQQAVNTGSKSQSAKNPCRICFVPKLKADDLGYNVSEWSRYDQFVGNVRKQARAIPQKGRRSELLATWGLTEEPSPWHTVYPTLTIMRQFAIDVMHSELKGMSSRFSNVLWDCLLTDNAKQNFAGIMKDSRQLPLPCEWSALQDPTSHRKSYSYTDHGRLIVLTPFILAKFLQSSHLKLPARKVLEDQQLDEPSVVAFIIRTFAIMKDHIARCTQDELTLLEMDDVVVSLPNTSEPI